VVDILEVDLGVAAFKAGAGEWQSYPAGGALDMTWNPVEPAPRAALPGPGFTCRAARNCRYHLEKISHQGAYLKAHKTEKGYIYTQFPIEEKQGRNVVRDSQLYRGSHITE